MTQQKNLLNLVHGELEKGCILSMATATPFLEIADCMEIKGNSLTFNVVDELVETQHRELGEDVEAVEIAPKKATVELKILTNSIKTDRALNVMNDVTEIHAQQTEIAMKSSGKALEKFIFNRLNEDITGSLAGKKFTGSALTLDLLDDAIDYVSATREGKLAIFVNPKTKRAITRLFMEQGYTPNNIEACGRQVSAYDNIPMFISEDLADNEIFVCRFGLDALHLITNGGLKTYADQRGVFLVTDVELLYNVIPKVTNCFAKVEVSPMARKK